MNATVAGSYVQYRASSRRHDDVRRSEYVSDTERVMGASIDTLYLVGSWREKGELVQELKRRNPGVVVKERSV